jgi:hypothetical protein
MLSPSKVSARDSCPFRRSLATSKTTGQNHGVRWRETWCRLWAPSVPDPWPAGAWHCPRCGRPLVGEGRPGRWAALRWELMRREQRVDECLVCGADPTIVGEQVDLEAEFRRLVDELERDGQHRWGRRLRACRHHGDGRWFCAAHYLWCLRRDPCYRANATTIDRLLVAIGRTFPATGPTPREPPFIGGPAPPWI